MFQGTGMSTALEEAHKDTFKEYKGRKNTLLAAICKAQKLARLDRVERGESPRILATPVVNPPQTHDLDVPSNDHETKVYK